MDGSLFVLLLSGLFWRGSSFYREYHYVNVGMSWPEAQSYCRERFTDLATADTVDDVKRLVNIVDAGYTGSVWIGLKRGTQKRWAWSTGENKSFPYTNYASGEPNGDGNCIFVTPKFWYDQPCQNSLYFMCFNDSQYFLIQQSKNWIDAQSHCRQYYTDLATIHNSEEYYKIKAITPIDWWIWVGLFLDSWEWSDKWSLFFRNWESGPPSWTSGYDCVSMSRINSGKWALERCDAKYPFICYGSTERKQIVRLKLSCNGECKLNDPSVQTAILNEIHEKLKRVGLTSDSKISWRKGEGEEVFHREINHVLDSNNTCRRYN